MAEQLFTIPVNEAFESDAECPFCKMFCGLEQDAIDFTLGPSYMEDDNREVTDRLGFCPTHIRRLYAEKNRLGLALMLNTHITRQVKELKDAAAKGPGEKGGLFGKKKTESPVTELIHKVEGTCFVCQRITPVFDRYIDTFFHLWKKDSSFQEKVKSSKGFCLTHYGRLYEEAGARLGKADQEHFLQILNQVFFDGMERVNGDLSWFIDKFDHRNADKPWNNSRDALPRAITKVCGVVTE